jgi:hypothetical protein
MPHGCVYLCLKCITLAGNFVAVPSKCEVYAPWLSFSNWHKDQELWRLNVGHLLVFVAVKLYPQWEVSAVA